MMNEQDVPGMIEDEKPAYPPAARSLAAARKLVGQRTRGIVKVTRRFVDAASLGLWKVEAHLATGEGIDYEVEITGDTLDEVAYALVDTLEKAQASFSEVDEP